MALSSTLILGVLGSFYAVLAGFLVYRSCKPSCRNCLHWQHCLEEQLGIEKSDHTPCMK